MERKSHRKSLRKTVPKPAVPLNSHAEAHEAARRRPKRKAPTRYAHRDD